MAYEPKFGVKRYEYALDELTETESFGIRDEKGREVGYRIFYKSCNYTVPDLAESYSGSVGGFHEERADALEVCARMNIEDIYYAESATTRNGQGFGAWKCGVFGATLDEVRTKIHKRRDGARKRYEKKYGSK